VARIGPAAAEKLGVAAGDDLVVVGPEGEITLPVVVDASVADGTVWVPAASPSSIVSGLGVTYGGEVTCKRGVSA